ncbi:hypothetical protein QYE76_056314 [Lolium multiflorum]|uniref:CCHC-type domain-containing protein n=1 Tax=Lolium multiflorum TaxID=4521 RepID=A0AAD8WQA9_LOLMU|nr:hypothetical protein QYE76_056314 [Lolium multiflorum]
MPPILLLMLRDGAKKRSYRLTVLVPPAKVCRRWRKNGTPLRLLTVVRSPSGARAIGKGGREAPLLLRSRSMATGTERHKGEPQHLISASRRIPSGDGGQKQQKVGCSSGLNSHRRPPPSAGRSRGRSLSAAAGHRGHREERGKRGFYLMSCIKDVPTLRGDNYTEWRKKVDFAFVCAEVDWVVDTLQLIKHADPVRDDTDNDDAWAKKKRDHAPVEMSYTLESRKWQTANKKCMAFIKNTIENAIVGSIEECASVGEYLEKIKSHFTGSSKTYATQLLKQLVAEKYSGGAHGIREHILRMSNLAAKLKPIDADLELKHALLVHLVMASLPQHFDNFVVNYNMNPAKWDIEKTIAMCVQEWDMLKAQNGGSINYVKDNKKRPFTQSNNGSPSKPYAKAPMQHLQKFQQRPMPVNKDQCLHCQKTGHYKKDCPDWLKKLMAKRWIPFDADYEKKRRMR